MKTNIHPALLWIPAAILLGSCTPIKYGPPIGSVDLEPDPQIEAVSSTATSDNGFSPSNADSGSHRQTQGSEPHVETEAERNQRIAVQLAVAVGVKIGARYCEDDDDFDKIAKAVARYGADKCIESSVNEALPEVPEYSRKQLIHALCAITDGDVLLTTLIERNRKEAWMDYLRAIDPSYANAAEVADFLVSAFKGS